MIDFSEAQSKLDAGDNAGAYEAFSALAQAASSEEDVQAGAAGQAYHMMGNAAVKLRRFDEAAEAYRKALADDSYGNKGTLEVNLGMVLLGRRRYVEAAECFENALSDTEYQTPYKAYMGLGNTRLKQDRPSDAGSAFRNAAICENNPDPAKSLLNLGVCFMALSRPHDAVEAYTTALEFDTSDANRNRIHANLGQAYVATGRMEEGVGSFESALEDGSYQLSESAQVDYDRAQAGLAGEADPTAGLDGVLDHYDEATEGVAVIPPPDDTGFFTLTEEQMNVAGKKAKKRERKMRNVGLKVFLVILVIILILVAAAGFAYYKGYGVPLQETTVESFFADNAAGNDISSYWADSDPNDISSAMNRVAKTDNVVVDAVSRSMTSSTVYATATLPEGGQARYQIDMTRDLLGWKITDVDLILDE